MHSDTIADVLQGKEPVSVQKKLRDSFRRSWQTNWQLYVMLLPVIAYFVLFHYWPMYGVQIAFKNYSPAKGIIGSAWVGMKHFKRFVNSFYFQRLLFNTLSISLYSLIVGFPMPIILALMLNEMRSLRLKKVAQTITYAPHFLSTVVVVSMVTIFLSPDYGLFNSIRRIVGLEQINYMTESAYFKTIYVLSDVWQSMGWGSIIYMAALTGVDPSLYESAKIDGASRLRIVWNINLPSILPTAIILLILNCGKIMNIGFEKIYLMQNDRIIETSDVISTYVYRVGLVDSQFSYSAAVGLFNSVINLALLLIVNKVSRKVSETSLW